jgi:hypothetical protein
MDYIINASEGAIIYQNNQVINHRNKSNLSIIKSLCKIHLTSYEGYTKAIHHTFGYKYKIPIYLSKHMQWIATSNIKCYENVWINVANIKKIEKDNQGTRVEFYSQLQIITNLTISDWTAYHQKLRNIETYLIKTLSSI